MQKYRGYEFHYAADLALEPTLRARFVPLSLDRDTRAFVDWALDEPQPMSTSWLRDIAQKTVNFYEANAIADAYHMQTLSEEQWGHLLSVHSTTSEAVTSPAGRSLLDVGAGDGRVTASIAPYFSEVLTTETSAAMVSRLRGKGWEARNVDLSEEPIVDRTFDLIAVQNVIDRTPRPTTLVAALPPLLRPGGLIAVLVPLPLKPIVFVKGGTAPPEEPLPREESWGANANALASWLADAGFDVVSLSRAPYLCRGDRTHPLVVLDDAVFLCRPRFTVPLIGLDP